MGAISNNNRRADKIKPNKKKLSLEPKLFLCTPRRGTNLSWALPPAFMDTDFMAPNNDYCIFKILPIKGMELEAGYVLR